jgi:hypothetical protein
MNKKLLLLAAAIFWIGLPALVAHLMFGWSPAAYAAKVKTIDRLGDEREAALIEATRHYVAANPDAPTAMREGKQLAPVAVLNAELKARAASFRVRSVKGAQAQFYEVS